jgi:F0F1-type ATP synthase delta subunit
MSTTKFSSAVKILLTDTQFLPSEQIVYELQLVQERLEFMPELLEQDRDHLKESFEKIFSGDVSPQIMTALEKIVITDEFDEIRNNSKLFLQACQEELNKFQELVFMVAVSFNDTFKEQVTAKIQERFDRPVRVTFHVEPLLIAGCLIREPNGEMYDYSLKTQAIPLAKQRIKQKLMSGLSR